MIKARRRRIYFEKVVILLKNQAHHRRGQYISDAYFFQFYLGVMLSFKCFYLGSDAYLMLIFYPISILADAYKRNLSDAYKQKYVYFYLCDLKWL